MPVVRRTDPGSLWTLEARGVERAVGSGVAVGGGAGVGGGTGDTVALVGQSVGSSEVGAGLPGHAVTLNRLRLLARRSHGVVGA